MERITLAQAVKIMLAQVKKIEEKETVSFSKTSFGFSYVPS